MDKIDLDNEIIEVREAIDQLLESNEHSAVKLARADLSYLLNQLNN